MLSVPVYWRMNKEKYRLVGGKCTNCGYIEFPMELSCRQCNSKSIKNICLSGKGTIYTYTVIRAPPDGFEAPYIMGIIRLEEGITVSGEIIGLDVFSNEIGNDLIGKHVYGVFRLNKTNKNGLRVYSLKFLLEKNGK